MIIGITGTDGAGKGVVVDYLVAHQGFVHYSSRNFIVAEIERQGLPVSREQTRLVANAMRKEKGNDVLVCEALAQMKKEGVTDAIIESIRATSEADTLKRHGGVLLAVDASPAIRYARIAVRGSGTDAVTYEQFTAQEALEMNDHDPNGMQKAAVMAMADYTIYNEGTMEELATAIELFLNTIQHHG